MADTLVYLYAVTDAADVPIETITGVDGAPVRRIVSDGLAAVVSSVDAARFGEEALRRNLEDLQWLEKAARSHHEVVAAVARSGPVAPVRLATVYLDDQNVRTLLRERASALHAALDRVRGRLEWGVKAYAAPAGDAADPEETADGSRPGTAYLMRRRTERERAAMKLQAAADAAEAVHRELAALTVANRRYEAQDPRLSGHREAMVLNAAYLVDEADADAVRRLVEDRDDRALRLELTGPWAPYSFATLEES
jgi:hypothetical protein